MKKLRFIYGFVRRSAVEGWGCYTRALAFDILYGLIPFLIFAAAVANLLGAPELLYEAVKKFLLPGKITEKILEYLYYLSGFDASGLAVMGICLSIGAFTRASMQIMDFADRKAPARRSLWKRLALSVCLSVLFLVTVVGLIVLIILGNRILAVLSVRESDIPSVTVARYAAAGGMLLAFLMLLFRIAPTKGFSMRKCFPISLMCMAEILLSSGLFSLYMDNYQRVSLLYGSLAAFMLLLSWVQLLSRILLFGFVLENREKRKKPKKGRIVGLSMMCYTKGKEKRTDLGECQLRGLIGKLL